ncbi:MAG: hypothetical protein K6F95_05350 [Selenomonas sp.]|uniref:hypothetical protein n=1 Tax=Selenomonas sp. TaxID=2053611 RepID=UPI0025DC5DDF|nr:hypothetical protein [Selenomonas sp.]MCR5757315.1 hypothetical protein [Selenomonas sp.]
MLNTVIHFEILLNIALILLVVCLATYTFAQDMQLRKYKSLLAQSHNITWPQPEQPERFSPPKHHLAA